MEAELIDADRQPKRPTLFPHFNQSRIFSTCFHESPQCPVTRKSALWKPNLQMRTDSQNAPHYFQILIKAEFSQHVFMKVPNVQLHENPPYGSRTDRCGQKDGQTRRS